MNTCQRCGTGRMFRVTDEHGDIDSFCLACGFRVVPTYTEEQRKRISTLMVQDKRIRGARRIQAGKPLMGF